MKTIFPLLGLHLRIVTLVCAFTAVAGHHSISQAAVEPADLPVVKFEFSEKKPQTVTEAGAWVDQAVLRALAKQRTQPWSHDVFLTYSAFSKGRVSLTRTKVTKLVQGLIGVVDNFDGYSNPLGSETGVTGFEVFLAVRLTPAPLVYRVILAHETIGHLTQMMKIYKTEGPSKTVSYFDGTSPESVTFLKKTHMTASLMEAQILLAVPKTLILADIEKSNLEPKAKDLYRKRYEIFETKGAKGYIVHRARSELKPIELSDAEAETIFEEFKKQGIDLR
jgi:hypothetical protein